MARLAHLTTARMTQLMSLLLLAPDIREELLFLPLSSGGRDPIREHMIPQIGAIHELAEAEKNVGEVQARPTAA